MHGGHESGFQGCNYLSVCLLVSVDECKTARLQVHERHFNPDVSCRPWQLTKISMLGVPEAIWRDGIQYTSSVFEKGAGTSIKDAYVCWTC